MTDFDTFAAQLHSELERIFIRYPDIDPRDWVEGSRGWHSYHMNNILSHLRQLGNEGTIEAFQQMSDALQQASEALAKLCKTFPPRAYLHYRLMDWRIPDRIAAFISGHWPKRFLPELKVED